MLIVFSGLPGVGKTTLSRKLAEYLGATYLRVDTIETAIQNNSDAYGYQAAYAITADNLRLGQTVIADCVNPCAESRNGWRMVAEWAHAKKIDVEIICSDQMAHRHRLETRSLEYANEVSWHNNVLNLDYEPWATTRDVIDTFDKTQDESFAELVRAIDR